MQALRSHDLLEVLDVAMWERPFLGVCMGMQALLTMSEENDGVAALGTFKGAGRHLRSVVGDEPAYKIPHMGWNQVRQVRAHPLWQGIEDGARFYFVHSYYASVDDAESVYGTVEYGRAITAVIARANVFATQFHPEKSQRAGLQLLENFLHWDGQT